MFIKNLKNCAEIIAGDKTILRELLHGPKEKLAVRYSLAYAIVKSGETSAPHKLKVSEVYYILEGRGRMFVGKESAEVSAGQAICIPPYSTQ